MVLPLDLILIRHGESEGNLAMKRGRNGDNSCFKNHNFKLKHTSLFRLTSQGVKQAKISGKWITENIGYIDKFYTSEYIRAQETAAHLGLKNATWKIDFFLRERDWGQKEFCSYEKRVKYKNDPRRKNSEFFYVPKSGESIAQVCTRLTKILNELHLRCSDKKVIIVAHGGIIRAFRVLLENLSQEEYKEMYQKNKETTENCQVFHYTRRNPFTYELKKSFVFVRTVVPWDLELKDSLWREVRNTQKEKTNEEILKNIRNVPRIIDNTTPSPVPFDYSFENFEIPKKYENDILASPSEEEDEEDEEDEEIGEGEEGDLCAKSESSSMDEEDEVEDEVEELDEESEFYGFKGMTYRLDSQPSSSSSSNTSLSTIPKTTNDSKRIKNKKRSKTLSSKDDLEPFPLSLSKEIEKLQKLETKMKSDKQQKKELLINKQLKNIKDKETRKSELPRSLSFSESIAKIFGKKTKKESKHRVAKTTKKQHHRRSDRSNIDTPRPKRKGKKKKKFLFFKI